MVRRLYGHTWCVVYLSFLINKEALRRTQCQSKSSRTVYYIGASAALCGSTILVDSLTTTPRDTWNLSASPTSTTLGGPLVFIAPNSQFESDDEALPAPQNSQAQSDDEALLAPGYSQPEPFSAKQLLNQGEPGGDDKDAFEVRNGFDIPKVRELLWLVLNRTLTGCGESTSTSPFERMNKPIKQQAKATSRHQNEAPKYTTRLPLRRNKNDGLFG
jgi:hypothetical protein